MTDKCIVLTTAGSPEEARTIARGLVERRLAACVNITAAADSVYRWKGEVETATEWLLIIKTTEGRFEAVQAAIREMHSYEVPECIRVGIEGGSGKYLEWLGEAVGE